MKVKIWGARGSIPAPLGPEAVREKLVSAFLDVARLADGQVREALISAISSETPAGGEPAALDSAEARQANQARRRQIIEKYLDSLSPLVGATASGNTPCVEIRSGHDIFIIDAGSGIRQLGLELMQGPCGRGEGVVHLFFSHPHWDHIQGFPFFRPAFIPGNKIFIYSVHDMETALERQQEALSFPVSLSYMQATRHFIRLKAGDTLEFDDLKVRNIRNHHPGDAYGFRFEKGDKAFVYASDASYPDGVDMRPYLNFFADAEVVIFDAQFTQRESDEKEDWGHSSSFVGIEMAHQARVKKLVLFHYDPTYSDKDLEKILEDALKFQQNQYPGAPPVNILMAQEGQTFDLTSPQKTQIQQVPGSKAAILKPMGVFDDHVALELREQFAEMLKTDQPAQIIVDMSGVEMLQVAGLRTLVKMRNEQQGLPMALAGPSINVQQLIDLAGYLEFFAIYPSVHAALKALRARETLNLPGQILKGRYKIESKIGDGHLGAVFRATDTRKDATIAIKVLSPSFSEGAIERFLQQARQIINLDHPNIAEVYDCDEDRGISFMATELIEGHTLRDLLEEYAGRPLPFDMALGIAEKITRALEYGHAHGVVHGDLKPKNVLLVGDQAKITDFGLGRLESGRSLLNINVPLALVTARYLAPEQVLGHPIDARTDLYALGVILYELFTGQPPFNGSDQEVLEHHLSKPPAAPRSLNAHLSRSLEHLILKLLDKDPNKRYPNARAVRHILSSMALTGSGNAQRRVFVLKPWPAFVGRTEILQQLAGLWAETKQGRGQIVVLKGASGLGKTRLAQELIGQLHEATVLIGQCRKIEGGAAYQAFISALKSYFDNVTVEVADKYMGQIWQEIVQRVPEIGKVIQGPTHYATDGGASQVTPISLIDAISQATFRQPWLLVLDDLHWADLASLNFLNYLARHCARMPLMIVGAYEEDGSETARILEKMLAQLSRQPNYTTISLTPFTERETKTLLENIWSPAAPAALITAIHHRTQGNPLFVEMIAKGLVDEGVVSWREDQWHFGTVVETALPQRMHEAILRRVSQMSRETQTLLNQAAVLGPVFGFEDLQEMSDLSEWDALENLDIALEKQLLTAALGDRLLRFRYTAIQQALYQELSALKQRFLHREAGEALERQHALNVREFAASLAHHFFQAGELEKGLIYSIHTANQANAIYASQNALYWYTRALDVIEQIGGDTVTPYQHFELLLARERIYNDQGLRQAQLADLKNLRALAQTLDEPTRQAQIHNRQATYDYLMGYIAEAATEAQAGLIAARQAGSAVLEGKSLIQLAYIAMHHGQFDQAQAHLQTAQTRLKQANNQQAEAQLLNGLGTLYRLLNDFTASETHYQHALTVSQLVGDRPGQAIYLSNLGDLFRRKGYYTSAKACQQQALLINQIIGLRQGEAACLNELALIHKELGQYEIGLTYVEQAKSLHHQIEDEQGLAKDLRVMGAIVGLASGNYVAARDYVGQSLEIFQRLKNKVQQMNTWLEFGFCLEGLGDLARARHAYEQIIGLSQGVDIGVLDARAGLARCLVAAGQINPAQQEIEACLKTVELNGAFAVRYPVRLYLTAYHVLQAAQKDHAARAALQQGQALLQDRATRIDDPNLQASYRENVPENKELLAHLEQSR
jgi:anti-anti-sigma factor